MSIWSTLFAVPPGTDAGLDALLIRPVFAETEVDGIYPRQFLVSDGAGGFTPLEVTKPGGFEYFGVAIA